MTVPAWLSSLVARAADPTRERYWRRETAPAGQPGHRESAVLLLFAPVGAAANPEGDGVAGDGPGADTAQVAQPPALESVSLLLTERAHTLRSHPGQVSFPGGRREPGDADLAATALRETHEEVGVDPGTVEVAGVLPPINLAVSAHDVSPVLGWWPRPGRVWVREPAEVASVHQLPLAHVVDPARRFQVRSPSGWVGPAFDANGLVVWGFTALVLADLVQVAGWERPWDLADVRDLRL